MPKPSKTKGKKSNSPKSKSRSRSKGKTNDHRQSRIDEVIGVKSNSKSDGARDSGEFAPKIEHYRLDESKIRYHNDRQGPTFRSAKISHRDGAGRTAAAAGGYLSPAFNNNNSPLLSAHVISPSHRSHSSLSPPSSILRSPSKSPCSSTASTPRTPQSVSFGAVEVHEFKLAAGAESDGVPDEGAFSLHFEGAEVCAEKLDLDEYERQRYARWKRRAQKLHWSAQKLKSADAEQYLWTAGRCDAFYSYLSPSEREQRVGVDKRWKRDHSTEIVHEREELDELRASRKRNHNIFCECQPLSRMSTTELKTKAREYGLNVGAHGSPAKVKRGYLLNQFTSTLGVDVDKCCWDATSCSCIAAGIDCHCGTETKHFQCGCVTAHTKCSNRNGRYMYKEPKYSSRVISEWKRFYQDVDAGEDEDDKMRGHGRGRIRRSHLKPVPFTL